MQKICSQWCAPPLYDDMEKVRFLCAVVDEYEFVCPAPCIYYDPCSGDPVFLVDRLHKALCLDFLIRHRVTGQAFLIDLQRKAFMGNPRMLFRKTIAEKYIYWKGYDWQYAAVFENDPFYSKGMDDFMDYFLFMNGRQRNKWVRAYLTKAQLKKPFVFRSDTYSQLDFLIHGII